MKSLQLTRGKARYNAKKFAAMRAAKDRKRLNPAPLPDEPAFAVTTKPAPFATVSIRIGAERVSFRVSRFDAKRLLCRGRAQAASTIGRRLALTLEALL